MVKKKEHFVTKKLFNSNSRVSNKVLLEHSYSYSLACTYVYFYVVAYKKKSWLILC